MAWGILILLGSVGAFFFLAGVAREIFILWGMRAEDATIAAGLWPVFLPTVCGAFLFRKGYVMVSRSMAPPKPEVRGEADDYRSRPARK